MYGFNEETNSEGLGSFTGIQENFELTKAARENAKKDGTSKIEVLAFYFNRGEFEFRHTEMPVNEEMIRSYNQASPKTAKINIVDPAMGLNIKKGDTITDDQAVKLAYKELNQKVKHILSKIVPEAEVVISATSWEDFCDKVSAKVASATKGQKLRLKFVYNNKNFLSFPKFGRFVENMSTPISKTTLKIEKDDKLTKDSPDQPAKVQDELPF